MKSKFVNTSHKMNLLNHICIIGNQAFSLLNFRGLLIEDLVAKGLCVFALAPDYDESTRAAVRALGAEPIDFSLSRTSISPVKDVVDMLRLAVLLNRLKPNVILTYTIKPVIYGILAAWIAHVPRRFVMIEGLGYIFILPKGMDTLKRRLLKYLVSKLYATALKHVDLAFFLNMDDIDQFLKESLIPPTKVFNLGGIGVDLDYWRPAPFITRPITFLLAARLLREKGIIEFVEAARVVKARYPETRFILLGGTDTNPGTLSCDDIERWVTEGIIVWPGHVVDVRSWIMQTSVYVLPSYREGMPRSTQEAMAMARPIITTDVPGCRETVVDGKNGFLVPVRNVDALVAAMERFVLQPDLIEKMGQASRLIAEERFDVHTVNQIIMQKMNICKS